ncbi:MGMT family protein [Nocardioides alcanivorans]|uniref:MGMT family protein n=1 Tax=Nocardioides alcanivorans TaxID=2897352 RepID=UPI001F249137|nr:MGMT family protein [Nocardioides alcanivorans]
MGNPSSDGDDYVEVVLSLVERIPWGRATTYGDLAEVVRERTGTGGPRQVGRVLSMHGGGVPWWRVVRADGRLPAHNEDAARQNHLAEGTAMLGPERVDLRTAGWDPHDSDSPNRP